MSYFRHRNEKLNWQNWSSWNCASGTLRQSFYIVVTVGLWRRPQPCPIVIFRMKLEVSVLSPSRPRIIFDVVDQSWSTLYPDQLNLMKKNLSHSQGSNLSFCTAFFIYHCESSRSASFSVSWGNFVKFGFFSCLEFLPVKKITLFFDSPYLGSSRYPLRS